SSTRSWPAPARRTPPVPATPHPRPCAAAPAPPPDGAQQAGPEDPAGASGPGSRPTTGGAAPTGGPAPRPPPARPPGPRAPPTPGRQPLSPATRDRLRRALLALAADALSGPGGLAARLRAALDGAPLSTVSLPLDIGAATETIPAHLRRAVTTRHPHCAFP